MWKDIIDNKSALIFDLDGTLVDSMWIWKQIDIDYFGSYGIDFPEDYQKLIEGMSFYETAVFTREHYNIPQTEEEMMATWTKMAFQKYSEDVLLKDGVIELLEYCFNKGIKLGIATSNSSGLCYEVLKKRDIEKYFEVILTGDEVIAGKPAPDVYLRVADLLGVDYDSCLVFEDLVNGIKAGLSAGMETVAVHDEYSHKSWDEKMSIAHYSINSYKEIICEICK